MSHSARSCPSPIAAHSRERVYAGLYVTIGRGTRLGGKYELVRQLGEGGMGVVWLAHHAGLDAEVAIKILRPEVLGDAEAVMRFDREARAAAVLRGPHIARILDVGKSEAGEPYMVMEYLEGCDLGAEILKRGALTVSETVTWVLEACEAVGEAHARGIIHRDLKPENLFLTELNGQRVVKLLDFGISRYADPGEVRVTQTHTSFGTPLYMSPEQVRSTKSVDERTDIWALGVILYEALAGEPPFLGDSPTAVAVAVTVDAYTPLRKRRHDVPAELEEIIGRALQKDPANRFKSVDEMARALAPLREGHGDGPFSIPARTSEDVADTRTLRISSVEPLSMGATPRRNGRLLLVGVIAGALLVGVLGAITVRSKLASRVGPTPGTTAANGHSAASSDAADPSTVDAETSSPTTSALSNGRPRSQRGGRLERPDRHVVACRTCRCKVGGERLGRAEGRRSIEGERSPEAQTRRERQAARGQAGLFGSRSQPTDPVDRFVFSSHPASRNSLSRSQHPRERDHRPRAWRRFRGPAGLALFAAIASGACQTATQITVDLRTDAACPGEVSTGDKLVAVSIVAGQPGALRDLTPSASATTCKAGASSNGGFNEVGTLVLVPDASNEAGVEVLIVAGVENVKGERLSSDACLDRVQHETMVSGDPCIVARRRLGFVPHTKLELPVQLDTLCTGVVCDADSTCSNGSCHSADVECDAAGDCELGSGGAGATSSGASQGSSGGGQGASQSSGGGQGGGPLGSSQSSGVVGSSTSDASSSDASSVASSSNASSSSVVGSSSSATSASSSSSSAASASSSSAGASSSSSGAASVSSSSGPSSSSTGVIMMSSGATTTIDGCGGAGGCIP